MLFESVLGLTRDHATLLLDALKAAAVDGAAVPGLLDRYGQRYSIECELVGPTGRERFVPPGSCVQGRRYRVWSRALYYEHSGGLPVQTRLLPTALPG